MGTESGEIPVKYKINLYKGSGKFHGSIILQHGDPVLLKDGVIIKIKGLKDAEEYAEALIRPGEYFEVSKM